MTDPDEANLKAERDAIEFEKLLEQLDRIARDKLPPQSEPEKDVDGRTSKGQGLEA